ncbi:MAG: hypothetical protein DRO05_07875 [Thermoproteota archaeon]|nr:MAG: hypothetical protein DRO05_07875 [Candidatus Korarchaeota archaeon]
MRVKSGIKRIPQGWVIVLLSSFLLQGLMVSGQPSFNLLWSYKTGGIVCSVSVSSDGSYVASGSGNGYVHFFDRNGNLLWCYKGLPPLRGRVIIG